jgi:non-ribosomal peptide synthetase component E (peptide arylation enzyme)
MDSGNAQARVLPNPPASRPVRDFLSINVVWETGHAMSEPQSANRTAEHDTFPKLLLRNAKIRGARPASREKEYGVWQTWSWSQVHDEVRAIACGLAAMGLKRGDKLAIIGDNRPNLYWTMVSSQAIGVVPVPFYQDSVAQEMKFVAEHAEVRFAVVEDQEQVDKLLELKGELPTLDGIVYANPRGLRNYGEPFLLSLADLKEKGREYHTQNPEFFAAEVAKGTGSDTAIILYTSGTTTSSSRRRTRSTAKACARTKRCSPICRWPGSATTSFHWPKPIAPASASVARKVRPPSPKICVRSARPITSRRPPFTRRSSPR